MTYQSIYVPKDLEQAKEIATLLDDRNPVDLLKCHAAFGHHFGGDMGKVKTQSYALRGTPSLNADAMAGICRSSGLVRYMRIVSWDEEHCAMEFTRKDEPAEVKHTFVFTIEMANKQCITRNRNWQQMPLQMLRSRVLTMGLRATFPDAVAGIYAADEIADNTNMSDEERALVSAASLGEEINISQAPQAPTPPPPPPKPKNKPLWTFTSEETFWEIVDEHGISAEEVQGVLNNKKIDLSSLNSTQLEEVFYQYVIHRVIRQSWSYVDEWWISDNLEAIDAQHQAFAAEYPILQDCPVEFYAPRMKEPAFVEVVRQACSMPDRFKQDAMKAIRYMKKNDWSKYYELVILSRS